MRARIEKCGRSLGLRIPKVLAEQAGFKVGSEVDLSVKNEELVVRPAQILRYDLKDLLRGVTSQNIHTEIEVGGPVGREAG